MFLLQHTLGQGGLRSGRQEKIYCCTATNKQTNKQTNKKKKTYKQTNKTKTHLKGFLGEEWGRGCLSGRGR